MDGFCVWLSGMPGAGKTTIAHSLEYKLKQRGLSPVILDEEDVQDWLFAAIGREMQDCLDTGDPERRMAKVASLIVKSGGVALVPMLSPSSIYRSEAYQIIGQDRVLPVRLVGNPGQKPAPLRPTAPVYEGSLDQYNVPTDNVTADDSVHSIITSLEERKLIASRHEGAASLFIGRWQPFHAGHKALIELVLEEGRNVVIAIRATIKSPSDPYTVRERKDMIRDSLQATWGYNRVQTIVIPDIADIVFGRTPGYGIRQINLTDGVEAISGTNIREAGRSLSP